MTDHGDLTLAQARLVYRASSSMAMPVAGLIVWLAFAAALALLPRGDLPVWAAYLAPALPLPLALAIDAARGALPR